MKAENHKKQEIREALFKDLQGIKERPLEHHLRKQSILSLVKTGQLILDIGTGDGDIAIEMALMGNKVVGIDIDEKTLDIAQNLSKKYNVEVSFKVGDATRLPFKDKTFDLILWGDVIEHFENPNLLLTEGYRVLKKDGEAIITVPNLVSLRNRLLLLFGGMEIFDWEFHKRYYIQSVLKTELEKNNFVVKKVTSDFISFPKFPIKYFKRFRVYLASIFPSLGHHIIIYAVKKDGGA